MRLTKRKRRAIASRISRERSQQPGYAELVKEIDDLKKKASTEFWNRRAENYRKSRALLSSDPINYLAYKAVTAFPSLASFLLSHPKSMLGLSILALVFFGWLAVLAVALSAFTICCLIFVLSRHITDQKKLKHKEALSEIDVDTWAYQKKIDQRLVEQIAGICDTFVGYPPDWNNRRLRVFWRDDYTCQVCFRKLSASELQAHHIVEVADGGTCHLSNLKTLCARCHGREHAN